MTIPVDAVAYGLRMAGETDEAIASALEDARTNFNAAEPELENFIVTAFHYKHMVERLTPATATRTRH
jgi:hypothetical protein